MKCCAPSSTGQPGTCLAQVSGLRQVIARCVSPSINLGYIFLLPQGVPMEDVLRVLRKRFGVSGVEEKAARPPKPPSA
jgi:hypothetical protein